MKTKALAIAILLAATNFAWAQGGLGIDNVEQHTNANQSIDTNSDRPNIEAQGPIDKFDVVLPARDKNLVDTNQLKQSYNGQA